MKSMDGTKAAGTLSIVATPIGNLGDLSPRAKETLKDADLIVAEDTRSLRSLLGNEKPKAEIIRGDAITENNAADRAIAALKDGLSVALITDAGTPAISDPGYKLVETVRDQLPEATIVAIPGPSALTAAISISGLPATPFTFYGFPPMKKGRKTFFETIANLEHTAVFYESPHRFMKMLDELESAVGESRQIFVGRELTKMHEEGIRGSVQEIKDYFVKNPEKTRGEFVVIVAGK